jgi:hypothetical protein
MKLKNLHVEPAGAKAELEHSAGFAFPLRVFRPPSGKTFTRSQRLIDLVEGRSDSDSMQNVSQGFSLLVDYDDCVWRHYNDVIAITPASVVQGLSPFGRRTARTFPLGPPPQ